MQVFGIVIDQRMLAKVSLGMAGTLGSILSMLLGMADEHVDGYPDGSQP